MYSKKQFNRLPYFLLALLISLSLLALPNAALARVPTQVEVAEADALLSNIEECAKDSVSGRQDKWSCVEQNYHKLLAMRLESVNPAAHWSAAHASWARGDIAMTYQRLRLIEAEFPNYENRKLGGAFTSVKTWLVWLDANYESIKLRQPFFGPPKELTDNEGGSVATKFANAQLGSTRHFEGYLPHAEYTFGDQVLVVNADGVSEKQAEPAKAPETVATAIPAGPPVSPGMDAMALLGSGFRSDSPTTTGWASYSLVLEARLPTQAGSKLSGGMQFMLDVRPQYGGYDPGVSWGLGAYMGRDWSKPSKVGTFTFLIDAGLLSGVGVHGANCQYNPSAVSADEVDLTCGYGIFPRISEGMLGIPGSFHNYYAGATLKPAVHLDVANSGVYLGLGAWMLGQLFILPGDQLETNARVVLADGTSVSAPYHWGNRLMLRGQVMPALVVGWRLPQKAP